MNEITIKRTIHTNQVLKIHPTSVFDIKSGTIKIIDIFEVPGLDISCLDAANLFLANEISGYDPVKNSEDIQQITEDVMDQPWIVYTYQYGFRVNLEVGMNERQYLPLDVFMNSTTGH